MAPRLNIQILKHMKKAFGKALQFVYLAQMYISSQSIFVYKVNLPYIFPQKFTTFLNPPFNIPTNLFKVTFQGKGMVGVDFINQSNLYSEMCI